MTDLPSTEERLAILERFAEAVSTRQEGEDQLQEGVSRLSVETNALNSILSRVDQQQQSLAALNKRTEKVEETAVSREELSTVNEDQERRAFDFRKKTLRRIYLTAMLIVGTLFVGTLIFFEVQAKNNQARYEVCVDRNEQSDILLDILRGVASDPAKTPPSVKEGTQRLQDKIVDCGVLK